MKNSQKIIWFIILLSFAIAILSYPYLPEKMASHWGYRAEVNGYMQKYIGLFLMPILSVILFILFSFIPKIDPLKSNIEKFRKYYDEFIVLIIIFLFYIYLLTIAWNLGIKFNMNQMIPPAIGLLFYYSGILIENSKRNWFIGIRTPWTLSSDNVWNKTHKIGGKLFKISGIISILGIFFGDYSIFFLLVPVIASSVYVTIYSYVEYRKENGK